MTPAPRTQVHLQKNDSGAQVLVVTSPDGSSTRHPLVAGDDPVGLREELFGLGYQYSPPQGELRAAALRDLWEAVETAAQAEIDAMAEVEGSKGFYDQDTGLPLCPADITRIDFSADSWDNGWFIYSRGEFCTGRSAGAMDYPEGHESHPYGLDLRIPAIDDGELNEQVLILTDRKEPHERFDGLVLTRPEGYVPPCSHWANIESALNEDPDDEEESD